MPSSHPPADTDPCLLRLSPEDNVCVVTSTIEAGEHLRIDGIEIVVAEPIPIGHKMAIRTITAGEKVFKHAAPIGSATCDITAGELVHTHNLKSDYIPPVTYSDHRPGSEAV